MVWLYLSYHHQLILYKCCNKRFIQKKNKREYKTPLYFFMKPIWSANIFSAPISSISRLVWHTPFRSDPCHIWCAQILLIQYSSISPKIRAFVVHSNSHRKVSDQRVSLLSHINLCIVGSTPLHFSSQCFSAVQHWSVSFLYLSQTWQLISIASNLLWLGLISLSIPISTVPYQASSSRIACLLCSSVSVTIFEHLFRSLSVDVESAPFWSVPSTICSKYFFS